VISRSQRSQLRHSAFLRPETDFGWVSVEHSSVFLAVLLVFSPHVAFAQTPIHSHLKCFFEISRVHRNDSLPSDADGDVVEEALCELLLNWLHVFLEEIGTKETNSAVDVKADTAW
jgi:hypothetical protein